MESCKIMIVAMAISFCYLACDPKDERAPDLVPRKPITVVLRPQAAILTEGVDNAIDPVESKINADDAVKSAQFIDADNGWVATDKSLYKTSDGGSTWERSAFNLSAESHVSSFFFIDQAIGWLTVVKRPDDARHGLGTSSRIMTSHDGGRSWVEQASFLEDVDIACISFLNSKEGLAIGARVVSERPTYDEIFALQTNDAGRRWTNISDKVRKAIENEHGIANDRGTDIRWSSPSRILLLTGFGRIVESTNQGEVWKPVVQFHDERPDGFVSSTGYYKLLVNSQGAARVIAGAAGEEGYWGDFVVSDGAGSWISNELIRIPILDAVLLSDDQILACGRQLQAYDEKTRTVGPSAGVILRSPDGGKTWSIVYRSKKDETFIHLSRMSNNRFYAVGDAGTFLQFGLKD